MVVFFLAVDILLCGTILAQPCFLHAVLGLVKNIVVASGESLRCVRVFSNSKLHYLLQRKILRAATTVCLLVITTFCVCLSLTAIPAFCLPKILRQQNLFTPLEAGWSNFSRFSLQWITHEERSSIGVTGDSLGVKSGGKSWPSWAWANSTYFLDAKLEKFSIGFWNHCMSITICWSSNCGKVLVLFLF